MAEMNTVTVQRANVILQISKEQLDYYLTQGYDVIDSKGNVIKASVPKDLGTLQKAFVDNQAEIERLKKQIAELKKSEIAELKKSVVNVTQEEKPEQQVKQQRTRTKKQFNK